MRLSKLTLTAFRGVSSSLSLPFDSDGKNLLVYGENGSAKSSFARALEYLFNPKAYPEQDINAHKNLFVPTMPEVLAEFVGQKGGAKHTEAVRWTHASGKPAPSWLLSSAARSAFLDHRKLLMLSDRTCGNLAQRFFQTAVEHLFGSLPVVTSAETVSSLWKKILSDAQAYIDAKAQGGTQSAAASGVAGAVAHHKPIEDAVNLLNQTLDSYLPPPGATATPLVSEAERLMSQFEGHNLKLELNFNHLTFNRGDGSFGGGEIVPKVNYCNKPLGAQNGGTWVSSHHEILNEARLTALALSLFFAAVRLQDQISYIAGVADPTQPARLLVLDDVLIGLDYAHRIPLLDILTEEFAKEGRFQIILMTHDRVWFDVCRLQNEGGDWKAVELYAWRGKGPDKSDFPILNESSVQLLDRAKSFLLAFNNGAIHELPAAANYTRSALESALRCICEKKGVPVKYRRDSCKVPAEDFIQAIKDVRRRKGASWRLIPLPTQGRLKALRSSVLNPFSHFSPSTVAEPEILEAISLAEKLNSIAKRIKAD